MRLDRDRRVMVRYVLFSPRLDERVTLTASAPVGSDEAMAWADAVSVLALNSQRAEMFEPAPHDLLVDVP